MTIEKERYIDIELNDICEYLDVPVCCHPIYCTAGEVTKDFCLKCQFRKIPVKVKAVKLLTELYQISSNVGFIFEPYLELHEEDSEEKLDEAKSLDDLSNKLKEVNNFLESVNIDMVEKG